MTPDDGFVSSVSGPARVDQDEFSQCSVPGQVEATGGGVESFRMPQPGELGIRERRSWRTWQLLTAVLIAAVAGMAIGHGGASSASSSNAVYTPPPPASPGGGAGSSTTGRTGTAPSALTSSSTTAGTSTTTTAPAAVLLPQVTARGSAVTPSFRVGAAPYRIGWAYDCRSAPGSTGTFQVYPLGSGQSPSSGAPAVNASGATGQGLTEVNSTGTEELTVRTPAQCIWAVKVTGVAG